MRKDKYIIQLTEEQIHICIRAMLEFRNYALERDIDTTDIDNMIKMLSKLR